MSMATKPSDTYRYVINYPPPDLMVEEGVWL